MVSEQKNRHQWRKWGGFRVHEDDCCWRLTNRETTIISKQQTNQRRRPIRKVRPSHHFTFRPGKSHSLSLSLSMSDPAQWFQSCICMICINVKHMRLAVHRRRRRRRPIEIIFIICLHSLRHKRTGYDFSRTYFAATAFRQWSSIILWMCMCMFMHSAIEKRLRRGTHTKKPRMISLCAEWLGFVGYSSRYNTYVHVCVCLCVYVCHLCTSGQCLIIIRSIRWTFHVNFTL